ncbi:MAG: tetratricopeptide repeat protein [Planctomycetota bacterium]|jgi:tetratricopeptide (TPR) repeat protein
MKKPEFRAYRWLSGLIVPVGVAILGGPGLAQQGTPKTGWGDKEVVEPVKADVAPDLQALFDRSNKATSVIEFNSIVEGSRTIAKDTTRTVAERDYAKKLLSWAANRRGEIRTDMAADMVRDGQTAEAQVLDRSATEDFLLAIQYDDTRWRAHHNLGILRALSGETEAALQSFDKTIELQPQFSDAYYNRAEIHVKQSDLRSAVADYDKAIELTPEDAGMRIARGRAHVGLRNFENALADFQEAVRIDPESGEAAGQYADTCQRMARWKEAALAYQKALQIAPNDPRILQNAAWMMATCPDEYYRNPEAALKTALRAVDASEGPVSAHRLHVLSVSQASTGDFASAIASINEALQLTSDPVLRQELSQHRALFQRKKPFVQPE